MAHCSAQARFWLWSRVRRCRCATLPTSRPHSIARIPIDGTLLTSHTENITEMPWGFIIGAVAVYLVTSGALSRFLGWVPWFFLWVCIPIFLFAFVMQWIGTTFIGPDGPEIVAEFVADSIVGGAVFLWLMICLTWNNDNGFDLIEKWRKSSKAKLLEQAPPPHRAVRATPTYRRKAQLLGQWPKD
jgi:hypothetical protein